MIGKYVKKAPTDKVIFVGTGFSSKTSAAATSLGDHRSGWRDAEVGA